MSNRLSLSGAFAIALALASFASGQGHAADYSLPSYAGAEDPVEFGSGWYIRGDLGETKLPAISTTQPTLPTATQPNASPPEPIITNGSRLGYDASIGAGYQFNRWFRADLIADFHQPVATQYSAGNGQILCPTGVNYQKDANGNYLTDTRTEVSGGCTGTYTGNLASYDVLLNGYVDLGKWSIVTPYVGAGVGLSFGHYQTASTFVMSNNVSYTPPASCYTDPAFSATYCNNYNRNSSGTYYNLAWALMAGAAFDVYNHTKLDLGYRYLNLGTINTGAGSANLRSQEVRVGLRYLVDN